MLQDRIDPASIDADVQCGYQTSMFLTIVIIPARTLSVRWMMNEPHPTGVGVPLSFKFNDNNE